MGTFVSRTHIIIFPHRVKLPKSFIAVNLSELFSFQEKQGYAMTRNGSEDSGKMPTKMAGGELSRGPCNRAGQAGGSTEASEDTGETMTTKMLEREATEVVVPCHNLGIANITPGRTTNMAESADIADRKSTILASSKDAGYVEQLGPSQKDDDATGSSHVASGHRSR